MTLSETEQVELESSICEYLVFYANCKMDPIRFREQTNIRIQVVAKKGFKVTGAGYDFETFTLRFHNEATGWSMRAVRAGGQYATWAYTAAYTPKDADLIGTYEWFAAERPHDLFAKMNGHEVAELKKENILENAALCGVVAPHAVAFLNGDKTARFDARVETQRLKVENSPESLFSTITPVQRAVDKLADAVWNSPLGGYSSNVESD
jgi:hypothetical protein